MIENINTNYIIDEIEIKEEDVNKKIRILNSYEECMRKRGYIDYIENEYKNEDEIKKFKIRINEELIPCNYYYQFKSKGKYAIKYSFETNSIINMSYMFCGCSSLTNINLSNFTVFHVVLDFTLSWILAKNPGQCNGY